jgi:hypothetical protein
LSYLLAALWLPSSNDITYMGPPTLPLDHISFPKFFEKCVSEYAKIGIGLSNAIHHEFSIDADFKSWQMTDLPSLTPLSVD